MVDIQHSITIMGGRDVSRPYRVWFFAEGELFFMFLFLCPQYLSSELDLASLEGDGLEFLVVAVFAHEGLE